MRIRLVMESLRENQPRFPLYYNHDLQGFIYHHIQEEKIIFSGPISFYLSSPKEKFIQQFAETLLKSPQVTLSRNSLIISNIEVLPRPPSQNDVTIRMLSPVTVYSTLFSANGKKKTYYYSPFEEEFSQLIRAWLGTYQIHGKPELISLAYDTGLGSKNSQGFGMFEILLKKVK